MLPYFVIPAVTALVAITGSMFTSGGMGWYRTINLPSWTPPGSLIGTVWTALFILAAISAIIVWKTFARDTLLLSVVIAFLVNALLNILWSYLFFRVHTLGASTAEAALLALSVLVLIILIFPRSRVAAMLLVPYFLWVSFATFLTWTVWSLNR